MSLLFRNATILTMNDALEIIAGDVLVDAGRIVEIGNLSATAGYHARSTRAAVISSRDSSRRTSTSARRCFAATPTTSRCIDWLKTRIWPMEAAHTPASLAAATRLAAAELLLGGTTTVLTMETVHDTDAVFEALEPMGLRAVVGKCMMDADAARPGAPARTDRRID